MYALYDVPFLHHFRWSSGFQATSLTFVDDHTLVYGSGNTLTFVRRDGSHVRSAPSLGKGVGCISVCSHSGLLAYSEVTLDPKIFLLSYPDLRMVSTLEGEPKGYISRVMFPSTVHDDPHTPYIILVGRQQQM